MPSTMQDRILENIGISISGPDQKCSDTTLLACQVHRWTCPWVEIQVSMIIRPHATRQQSRTTPSRARLSQRSVYHRFIWANEPANHTCFGITLRQKHNAVAALRVIVTGQHPGQSHQRRYLQLAVNRQPGYHQGNS